MTTDNRPPIRDHSLLFPLLVGILSLIGIGILLAFVLFPRQDAPIFPTRTVTPFKYLFLGTETVVPTLRPETLTPFEYFPIVTSEAEITPLSSSTEQRGTPQVIPLLTLTEQMGVPTGEFTMPVLTITPESIFSGSVPLAAGTYDAADSKIIRSGSWTNQSQAGVYKDTLLVSNLPGDYIALSFIGYQMTLGYQSSTTAGDMRVNIDGSEQTFNQRSGNEWSSEELEAGTHYVILTHESGGTLNLDFVVIFE